MSDINNTIREYNQLCQRVKHYLKEHKGYLGFTMMNFEFETLVDQFGCHQVHTNFWCDPIGSNDPNDRKFVGETIPISLLPSLSDAVW